MATTAPPKTDSAPDHAPPAWKPELHEIPVDAIDVGTNVRSDVGDVSELAASIAAQGVISPVRVAEVGGGRYELVYGQRRLAAAKLAGLETIPAIVDAADRPVVERAVAQLLENLQREDLNALDTAKAYREILDQGVTQRELATLLGVAQPTIANTLRVLKAPDEIQAKVAAGELTRSHVEAIAKLPAAEQKEVARRIAEHGLSTRDIEHEVRLAKQRQQAADRRRDEARNLADVAEASLAKKKGVTKETAKLRFYDVDLGDEMRRRGWTTFDRSAGYGKPKGCDCLAFEVSRNYMGSSSDKSVTITAACLQKAHFDAAEKTADEERRAALAKAEAERKEREAKERAEHAAKVAPVIERLTADAELRGRVLLWTIVEAGGWGGARDAFDEEAGSTTWEVVSKLPIADVERWALAMLADDVLDDVDVLAAVVKPKPAKKAKATS